MAKLSADFLDEIRGQIPVSGEVRAAGIELKQVGQEWKALCPFHNEKTPSFTVNDSKQFFHCFGCGHHGDIFAFHVKYHKTPFRDAVRVFAARLGLEVPGERDRSVRSSQRAYKRPDHKPAEKTSKAMLSWFKRRGIPGSVVERHHITMQNIWMPQTKGETPVICFPYYRGGQVVNVKYRDSQKNFRQEKDAEKIFYGLDDVAGAKEVIIVEGEVDKLSLEAAGILNVVSVPDGAPGAVREGKIEPSEDVKFSFVWNSWDEIESCERFVLACDADEPGQALAEELSRRLGKEKCWKVSWPSLNDAQLKDANEVLVGEGPEVLRECISAAVQYPIADLFDVDTYRDDVLNLYRHGYQSATPTGWVNMNKLYRVKGGHLTIISGVPGSGKSEWLDALTMNLAEKSGWRFAMCSFENPPEEHIAKLAEKRAEKPFFDYTTMTTRMGEGELVEAMAWLEEHYFFIRAEDAAPTIDWILETASAAVLRYGIRGLVVDPWNEVEQHRAQHQSETEYVGESLSKCKRWALLHDVHVWIAAHPAKMSRERRKGDPIPSLYDISGSAHWANKADVGIIIVRQWEEGGKENNSCEVHVRKVRFKWIGRPGIARFNYLPRTGRYEEVIKGEKTGRADLN